MVGFIKIDRRIAEWEWHSDPFMMSLWIHLLVYANFEDRRWLGTELRRGQVSISVQSLADHIGLTPKQIRLRLDKLQRTGEIVVKGTNRNSIITICKYDTYQGNIANIRQTKDKPKTNRRQTEDTQKTTNKEIKNDENDFDLLFDNKLSHNKSLSALATATERERFIEYLFFEKKLTATAATTEAERFIANYERSGWLDRNGHKVRNKMAALKLWETKKDVSLHPKPSDVVLWRKIYDCAPDPLMIQGFYGFETQATRNENSGEWEEAFWLIVTPALKKYLQSDSVRPLIAPLLLKEANDKKIMIRTINSKF